MNRWRTLNNIFLLELIVLSLQVFFHTGEACGDVVGKVQEAGLSVVLEEKGQAPSEQFQITIRGTNKTVRQVDAAVFALENPVRIVIDVNNKQRGKAKSTILKHPLFSSIRLGVHSDKTRIVLDVKGNGVPVYQVADTGSKDVFTLDFTLPGSAIRRVVPAEVVKQQANIAHIKSTIASVETSYISAVVARKNNSSSGIIGDVLSKRTELDPVKTRKLLNEKKLVRDKKLMKEKKLRAAASKLTLKVAAIGADYSSEAANRMQDFSSSFLSRLLVPREMPSAGAAKKVSVIPKKQKNKKIATVKRKAPNSIQRKKTGKIAYTVKGRKLELVEIGDKKTFTKTPVNPAADHTYEYSMLSIPPSRLDHLEFDEDHDDKKPPAAKQKKKTKRRPAESQAALVQHVDRLIQKAKTEEYPVDVENVPSAWGGNMEAPAGGNWFMVLLTIATGGLVAVFTLHRLKRGMRPRYHGEILMLPSDLCNPRECYMILGCDEHASDKYIRDRYKHLVKAFHSDKLASQDLPAEVLELTNEQFKKVQKAYEAVKEMRGFH